MNPSVGEALWASLVRTTAIPFLEWNTDGSKISVTADQKLFDKGLSNPLSMLFNEKLYELFAGTPSCFCKDPIVAVILLMAVLLLVLVLTSTSPIRNKYMDQEVVLTVLLHGDPLRAVLQWIYLLLLH